MGRSIAKVLLALVWLLLPDACPAQVFVYGGPGSLEGRFEDAGGSFDAQGWLDVDCTSATEYWQVSTFMAENLNGHGANNHALWAGQDGAQQPSWAYPPGYGNDWRAAVEWVAPAPDPTSAVEVGIEFYYNLDTEETYDFLMVEWYDGMFWNAALNVSGSTRTEGAFLPPGEHFSQTWTIQPSQFTGPGQDEVRLRLFLRSDGGVSDQDNLLGFDTDGAAQVDDIRVTFDGFEVDGGGDPDGIATFENGDDEGWTSVGAPCVCAILSHLPEQYEGAGANPTPVLARINDCSLRLAGRCLFTSPLIGWTTTENLDGSFLRFDAYFSSTGRLGFTQYRIEMSWKVAGVWQPAETVFVGDVPAASWQDVLVDLSEIAPVGADSCAMRFDTSFGDGEIDIVAIDNVTLARYDTVVAAPAATDRARLQVRPNPANPRTTVEFEIDRVMTADVAVYDVRGRLVRRLASRRFDPGVQRIPFDGRDSHGDSLASGVYFVRLALPSRVLSTRVTLVK